MNPTFTPATVIAADGVSTSDNDETNSNHPLVPSNQHHANTHACTHTPIKVDDDTTPAGLCYR